MTNDDGSSVGSVRGVDPAAMDVAEAMQRIQGAGLLPCEFHGEHWNDDCDMCTYWQPVALVVNRLAASPLPEGRPDGRAVLAAIASAFEDAASEFDDPDADDREQWFYQWLTDQATDYYRQAAVPVVAVPEAEEAFEVFDGPPSEAFGGIDPESRARYERTLDQIEEAERR